MVYCAILTRFNNGPWSAAADMMICPMSIRMPVLSMIRGSYEKHGLSPTNTRVRGKEGGGLQGTTDVVSKRLTEKRQKVQKIDGG